MSVVVVVSGPPCSGKSTLAVELVGRCGWPLLAKDDYKERVFRELGARDRDWSRRVSALAWDLLFAEAERLVRARVDCLLDGNFRSAHAPGVSALAAQGARLVEVACTADPRALLERFQRRIREGSRHPGHVDREALPDVEREFLAPAPRLVPADAPRLLCDTSGPVDVAALASRIEDLVAAARR
jgi:predicted kinase